MQVAYSVRRVENQEYPKVENTIALSFCSKYLVEHPYHFSNIYKFDCLSSNKFCSSVLETMKKSFGEPEMVGVYSGNIHYLFKGDKTDDAFVVRLLFEP